MAATQKVSPAQVLDALIGRPGVTAAEQADALGLGQSTAAKHLAALEAAVRPGASRAADGSRTVGPRPRSRIRRLPTSRPPTRQPALLGSQVGSSGWAGGRWARWSATTWPPGTVRTSARPRWPRAWAARAAVRSPTRWPAWRRPARPAS